MGTRRHVMTDQEWDQARREEEMRKHRETQAQAARDKAHREAHEARAKAERETPAPPAGLKALDPPTDDIEEMFESGPPVPLDRLADLPALPSGRSDTETLLNGLIEECRYLLREVAFNSARLTPHTDDRIRFLSSAESLALTGAKIADTVGRLRGGGAAKQHHQVITVEHVQKDQPAGRGEGG